MQKVKYDFVSQSQQYFHYELVIYILAKVFGIIFSTIRWLPTAAKAAMVCSYFSYIPH
jgi:hypothetical protein